MVDFYTAGRLHAAQLVRDFLRAGALLNNTYVIEKQIGADGTREGREG